MEMETEPETWTSDQLEYGSLVRRQIARTADLLSRMTGSMESVNLVREHSVREEHAVWTLSDLLDPYKPDGFSEELVALTNSFNERIREAKASGKSGVDEHGEAEWKIAVIRSEANHQVFRRLLGLAKRAGLLLQEDLVEGAREE